MASWPGDGGGTGIPTSILAPAPVPVIPNRSLTPRGTRIIDEPDEDAALEAFLKEKLANSGYGKENVYWRKRLESFYRARPMTREEKQEADSRGKINVDELANAMLLLAGVGATIASVIPVAPVAAVGAVGKAAVLNALVYQSGQNRSGYSRGVSRTARNVYPEYGYDKGNTRQHSSSK